MGHKILFVDDDENLREVFSRGLQKEGFVVVTAGDGEEALQKIESEHPEVVVLDLMMPKLNGFEVLQQIRKKYKQWIPVIINSAEKDLESVRKAYSMEADHYLTKPCGIEVVVRGINSMISLIPMRIQEGERI